MTANIAVGFAGGDGSSENPWEIDIPEQLDNLRDYPDKLFKLSGDIDLEEEDEGVRTATLSSHKKELTVRADDQSKIHGNVGYEYRSKETLEQVDNSHSMLYGAGVVFDIPDAPVHLSCEIYGRSERLDKARHSPLEALVSAGRQVGGATITGGVARGLNNG